MNRWASRKFLVTLAGMVGGVALAWAGKLDVTTAGLLVSLHGAYLAGNVVQKVKVQE